MNKCDFCKKQTPSGHCAWTIQNNREKDCEIAIKRMMIIMQNLGKNEKQNLDERKFS